MCDVSVLEKPLGSSVNDEMCRRYNFFKLIVGLKLKKSACKPYNELRTEVLRIRRKSRKISSNVNLVLMANVFRCFCK